MKTTRYRDGGPAVVYKVCFLPETKVTKRNKRDTKFRKEYRKGGNNGKIFWILPEKNDAQLLHFCYGDSILKPGWGKVE